jgi:hypothetical protein
MSQCPSCGGDCGYTKTKGCQYNSIVIKYALTKSEQLDIDRIVKKWDYATEACIEAYLLGKKRGMK